MGRKQRSARSDGLLRYGLLLGFLLLYGAVFVGGFAAVFLAASWVDTLLLQPRFGVNSNVSYIFFGVAQLGYIALVFYLTTSRSETRGPEPADTQAMFQENR
ncbi:hypothetical protein OB955_16145 [Halobacteria archaeon AArc-m2/3/4]|uniref:Uncharacterized protein n=1 Tax=Natronoglomus mannanivorans TaxID=2979990 RepID=A0AAP2Z202_9EURY|nr:hypothetical protein [Halobacteria archaeon AArc-xg1-1]MCU4974257.1 hypothetical protein [Halobacteria archaeon AArc-m2/3/4]